MRQSRPIMVGASLLGAAVEGDRGWHVIAVDPRIEDINGAAFPSPEEAERIARLVFDRETHRTAPPIAAA